MKLFNLEPEKTVGFVRESLSNGGTFAKLLLEYVDLARGEFFATLPDNISGEHIYEFTSGRLHNNEYKMIDRAGILYRTPNIDDEFVKFLSAHFSQIVGFYLFEDLLAQPEDKLLESRKNALAVYNEEVYYRSNGSQIQLNDLIRWSKALPVSMGVYIKLGTSEEHSLSSRKLSYFDLASFSRNVIAIILNAYDAEGFVVWLMDLESKP